MNPARAEYDPATGKYKVEPPRLDFRTQGQTGSVPRYVPIPPPLGTKFSRFPQAAAAPPVLLYRTDGNNDALVVWDTKTDTVVKRIPVGKRPNGVALTPDSKLALVANQQSSSVSVVNLDTLAVAATIPLPASNPMSVAITPDGLFAYVTNGVQGAAAVYVIDIARRALATTIRVGGLPIKLAVTPDGAAVWVANSLDKTVSLIDTLTNAVFKTLTVDSGTLAVGFNTNGTRAYVTGGTTLNVIDPATYAIIAKVQVGSYPIGITVDPTNGDIFVANRLSPFVSRINGYTNTLIENISVPLAGPESVVVVPVY